MKSRRESQAPTWIHFVAVGLLFVTLRLPAGTVYQTDFETFTPGDVDGQDGWTAAHSPSSGKSWGTVVDDGTGNLALAIRAGTPDDNESAPPVDPNNRWGGEVKRLHAVAPTRRFVTVEVDFQIKGNAYWFLDNFVSAGGPESLLFSGNGTAWSNADPGIGAMSSPVDTWHHIGLEIDQELRRIVRVKHDGVWKADADRTDVPSPVLGLVTRGYGFVAAGTAAPVLWLDNLRVVDSDESPVGSYLAEQSPRPNQTGALPNQPIEVTIVDGPGAPVEDGSIVLKFDGEAVVPAISRSGVQTRLHHQPGGLLAPGSVHSVHVSYATSAGAHLFEWTYTVADYRRLVPAMKVEPDTSKPGFGWRISQADMTGWLENSNRRTEDQLAGRVRDEQGVPRPNRANPAATGAARGPAAAADPAWAPIAFEIESVINLGQTGGDTSGNFVPDAQMPGIPGTGNLQPTDNIAAEVRTFLELPAGLVTFGVNSDDGFRLTAGRIDGPGEMVIGEFDGGRGSADTLFAVWVDEPGVYPFRTIWEEGGAAANLEWFSLKADGTKVLVNDVAHGGLKAYRAALASAAPASWASRQHDSGNTGRADYSVPGSRLNGTFFDTVRWQRRTPNSPDEGSLGSTTMTFFDRVGPGGADLVVGGYHWPKGVQGMDRHNGRLFWAGNPDGGESIGEITPAFSPDGRTIYVANDATAHPLMAFRSDAGPSTFWHNGSDAQPDLFGNWSPKAVPDGRVFSHGWNDRPRGAIDSGDRLALAWSATNDVCACFSGPGFDTSGADLRVIGTGRCGWVRSFNGTTGDQLWAVEVGVGTDADPTVDPRTGRIYVPAGWDSIDVVGLSRNGQPLWGKPALRVRSYASGVNHAERAQSGGCLSHDGSTFYFQTVSQEGDGRLYAIRTDDGSVKWSFETQSRGWEGRYSSPVVSSNGVVVVGNNENGTYHAIHDRGTSGRWLDTLKVAAPGMATASATISPDGLLYLPARLVWSRSNGDGETPSGAVGNLFNAFDLTGTAGTDLAAPSGLEAAPTGRSIVLTWVAVADPENQFAAYVVYRSTSPILSVAGLLPLAMLETRATIHYTNDAVGVGTAYYFAVTTLSKSGGESSVSSTAGPVTVPVTSWPMHQRDAFNTGRADFTVPAARLNDRFFDAVRWEKRTPDSPGDGRISTTSLVFFDGAGPGGADLVVGGYHWPKGVLGLDRHTGRFFWSGNPDGGESIGANSAAFSPDGRIVYVANDATAHPLMAFPAAGGPSVYWHNGADSHAGDVGAWTPKVLPDGTIAAHGFAGPTAWTNLVVSSGPPELTTHFVGLSARWLSPVDLCSWQSGPAWLSAGGVTLVIGAGGCGHVAGLNSTNGAVVWDVETGLPTEADPTVDPADGRIFVPAGQNSIWLVGLDRTGAPLWGEAAKRVFEWRSGENQPQRASSAGCLSQDGATFYFQTVAEQGDGRLYAVRTSDGSLKWSYASHSRGWGGRQSSPIVFPNAVVVVGNNEGGTYFALRDAGDSAVLVDQLTVASGGTASASPTVSPDGLLYLPARLPWTQSNGDEETPSQQAENLFAAFDLTENPVVVLPPPPGQFGRRLNHAVEVAWQPVAESPFFSQYAIYRSTQPFDSLAGLTPVGTVSDRLVTSYLDSTAENGTGYYYFVTTVTTGGHASSAAKSVGPFYPVDETDLQVVCIARTPRFPRYRPQYTGYELAEPAGFGPYSFSAATGLEGGETAETPRWPPIGAPVTFTATVRNRGSNPWNGPVHGHWEWDGVAAGNVTLPGPLAPGATTTSELQRPWDGELHEARFVLDDTDARPANNALAVGTKSVPFLTYIDENYYVGFTAATRGYPGAVTDDLIDWLNRHMARFNAMFAESGSPKRVHYDVLELLASSAPDPAIAVPAFGVFPFRYRGTDGEPRLSGWYDASKDIDFGLLHEMGHQLGLIDIYQLDLSPEMNKVSGLPYSAMDDLMRACSPFLSPHSALAMTHWLDQAHGYFGQYLYGLPATMRLRIVDAGGQPVPGVAVTMYQLCERPGQGKVISTQAKASGSTDAQGEWVLPNVPLDPSKVPVAATGDALHDNPFGYVDVVGRNGVLHFKLERNGQTCFAWLAITEANVAYYQGRTNDMTFTRQWAGSGVAPAVPAWLPVEPLVLEEDVPKVGVPLPALDGDTPFAALEYSVETTDPALLPPAGLTIQATRTGARLDVAAGTNAFGSADLVIHVSDGAHTNDLRLPVTVRPVNDPPALTLPATMTIPPDQDAAVKGADVQDPDAAGGAMTLLLAANHGILRVDLTVPGGVVPGEVTGNGTRSVRVDAGLGALRALLAANGISYTPDAGYDGGDVLQVRVSDNGHTGSGGALEVSRDASLTVLPHPQVVGRWVFYNQSVWDGNNAAANAADDAAIAPDKSALLPGAKAAFTNYTSYHRGLNGIMVDIRGLAGTPTVADFGFRVGNSNQLGGWVAGPTPAGVTVRAGAGTNGSDRVTLVWGADAVKKRWLEVTVRATPATGLSRPDVFYFGNAIGEVGNSPAEARVTSVDALRVLSNVSLSATLTNRHDVNRDGKVGAADRLAVLGNLSALDPLVLLDLTGGDERFHQTEPGSLGAERIVVPILEASVRDGGLWVRLRAPGTPGAPVIVRTAEAPAEGEWEIYDVVVPGGGSGDATEVRLPIDLEGPARFYRLESPGPAAGTPP